MRVSRRHVVVAVVMSSMLAACQDDAPGAGSPSEALGADASRASCEAAGGNWGTAYGGSSNICFTTPRDAGQACAAQSDCETLCLARSRTCAPVKPFLGCHEVLTDGGGRATLCTE